MARQLRAVVMAIALVIGGCGRESLPVGPLVCEVETSSNACFRCQAQRCGAQLDQCYGQGFHEGRSVGVVTQRRCVWNSATGQYDRDCTYGLEPDAASAFRNGGLPDGGSPGAPAVACGYHAICLQSCGCGSACAEMCARPPADAAATTYYANDPRLDSQCSDCVQTHLAACARQSCAAECGDFTDAGR